MLLLPILSHLVNLTHKRSLEESEDQNTMQRQQIENIVEEFDLPESDAENPSLDDIDEPVRACARACVLGSSMVHERFLLSIAFVK